MNPEALTILVKRTNLAFLLGRVHEAKPYALKADTKVTTHGAVLKDKTFVNCLQGDQVLPAGTLGMLFVIDQLSYSATTWIHDEQYPTIGADIILNGRYYTWISEIDLQGNKVTVSHFASTKLRPRKIGTVEAS